MNHRMILVAQAVLVFGVIVLPQVERAARLEQAIARGRMVENAYILEAAAERYAEADGGLYASAVHILRWFLPAGQQLVNPVTRAATEPVDGQASSSGQLGYTPISAQGYDVGYTITVFGADQTQGPAGDGIMLVIQKITDPPSPPMRER